MTAAAARKTEEIEVCKLSDGTLSVRYQGKEIYLLPPKSECSERDIKEALKVVMVVSLNVGRVAALSNEFHKADW